MSLSSNTLRVQVDTPIWEWCRTAPAVSTVVSNSCTPDNSNFHPTSGRYIYYLISAASFWRYDTWTDTYMQLSNPVAASIATRVSMKFAGSAGYFGRVISATSTTLTTGLPFGAAAKGFKIRIISGTGDGQERYITSVTDPVVADFGVATSGALLAATPATLIDATKTWTSGYTGSALNYNNWVGYVVRTKLGTGLYQIRKILYNNATTLFIGDTFKHAEDPWCHVTWVAAPAAGTQYQIESSTITIDTAWTVTPDNTTRYVIQSGGIYVLSAGATPTWVTMQYYDILSDTWYVKPVNSVMVNAAPTDLTLERTTENASVWWHGIALGTTHSTTKLQDTAVNWTVNEWANYYVYVYSGTGRGVLAKITSNTSTELVFPAAPTATRTCAVGEIGTYQITTTAPTPNNCCGFQISGTGVGVGATIVTGQGTTTLIVTVANSGAVDGQTLTLTYQPDNTTRYQIMGFDAGQPSSATYNTLVDTAKTGTSAWAVNRWANYAVRIMFGTGAGQLRSILSNTANTLSLYNGWNVIPDATSVYIIQGDSNNFYFATAAAAATSTGQITLYRAGDTDMISHGRILDTGVACVMCALLCDANHVIAEQPPIAIATIARSGTTATVTTVNPHNLITGQYVSIRGPQTGADVPYYNGKQQITGVPVILGTQNTNTFTFTISASAGASATGLPISTTSIVYDASKDHRQVALGGVSSEFTITFSANTPTGINGWYVNGTNIGAGARVASGAGTTTLTLDVANGGTVSGVIIFNAWAPNTIVTAVVTTGTSGLAVLVLPSPLPAYCANWYVSGTGIGIGAQVFSGAGTTTIVLTKKNTASVATQTATFHPSWGEAMIYGHSAAVTVTTGAATVGQAMQIKSGTSGYGGNSMTLLAVMANTFTAGNSRYVIAKRDCLGAANEGNDCIYCSGVATTGAAGSITDAHAFYTTGAECNGAQYGTSLTLTNPVPGNINGWYLTAGAGINVGTRVVSGQGTTTLTLSIGLSAAQVNSTLTFCAWNTSAHVNKRIKLLSGSGAQASEGTVATTVAATGVITYATAGATAVTNVTSYSIISSPVRGIGTEMIWASGLSDISKRGKYLILPRGTAAGFDRLDITTDKFINLHTSPVSEVLGVGSMYVYDGGDRMYFCNGFASMRLFYLDLITYWIHGAGQYPYLAGTTLIGTRMEIIETADRLKYLWLNRHANIECYKQLLFY